MAAIMGTIGGYALGKDTTVVELVGTAEDVVVVPITGVEAGAGPKTKRKSKKEAC